MNKSLRTLLLNPLAQRAALAPYLPEYSAFVDHCDRIVKRAVAEDKGVKLNADGTRA
jgi:hypothetical protein